MDEKKPLMDKQAKEEEEMPESIQETDTTKQRLNEMETLLKRLQADFDNFRKRTEKEKEELTQQVNAAFILKLLPVIDEFEYVLKEAKKHKESEAVGLEMLHKNIMSIMAAEGVREMNCEKAKFDPYLHDAIQQEASDVPAGHISSVVKKGYYLGDRVLRHALVVVSKGKEVQK